MKEEVKRQEEGRKERVEMESFRGDADLRERGKEGVKGGDVEMNCGRRTIWR